MYSVKKEEAPFKETSFLSYLHASIIIVTYPVDQVLFIFYYFYHKLWWKGWKSETKLPRWKKLYIYIYKPLQMFTCCCECLSSSIGTLFSTLSLIQKIKTSKNTPWDRYWMKTIEPINKHVEENKTEIYDYCRRYHLVALCTWPNMTSTWFSISASNNSTSTTPLSYRIPPMAQPNPTSPQARHNPIPPPARHNPIPPPAQHNLIPLHQPNLTPLLH